MKNTARKENDSGLCSGDVIPDDMQVKRNENYWRSLLNV
jgi:hypothetical protein